MKILVVDDTQLMQQLLKTMFMMYDSVTLVSCVSTIKLAKRVLDSRERYDLVVSDYNLKRETGLDLLQFIKSQHSELLSKTIILSGEDKDVITRALAKAGFKNEVYTKPFSIGLIADLVGTFENGEKG